MLRWDRVGLFWNNWSQVNITVIPFADLLCITEGTSNTFPRNIFPLWFPVGLGSITDSHSRELWKMKGKKMLFIGGRSMSRYQLWSLQELLPSVHWGVWQLMRSLGIIHFRATCWDTHLPLSGSPCVMQQLQHQLLRTAIGILHLSGLFLPFPALGPTMMSASNSGYYQRHIEQLLFSQTLTPWVILNIMGETLEKLLACSTDYILLLWKKYTFKVLYLNIFESTGKEYNDSEIANVLYFVHIVIHVSSFSYQ